jgi:hypothetical protein
LTIWAALAGGFLGTIVLTTMLQACSELGLTRMDIPFLLGTAFTEDRTRARALGYALHAFAGLAFAVVYFAIFSAIGENGWLIGALFGLVHALFASTTLVSILLPAIHPRMGTTLTAAPQVALLEPPGFMMRNYGLATPLVTIVAHIVYGAIVGGFVALS